MRRHVIGSLVLMAIGTATTLAQSPPAASAPAQSEPTILIATAGARSLYEVTRDRALSLPRWDPARTPDPPLSLGAARKAAEAWLEAQNPLTRNFNLTGSSFFRFFGDRLENCGPAGCWYYRLTFEPILEGVALSERAEMIVVVLLDGSIVWPRGELPLAASAPAQAPAAPAAAPEVADASDSERRFATPMPDANGVYRLGNGVWSPRLLRMVRPQYTGAAMRARIEGNVALECVVKMDGTVGDVRVLTSLQADLDQEAIKAVKQWRFAPATFRDEPVAAYATCQVEFRLR